MNASSPPLAPLVMLEPPPGSLRLYCKRNLVPADSLANTLERCRGSDGYAWLAFRPHREIEMRVALGEPLEVVLRTSSLVLARVARR